MFSRSEPPKSQTPDAPKDNAIDSSRRYDIYCWDRNNALISVVYRNAKFVGRKKLLSNREHDFTGEFWEIEQSNGKIVYISSHSIYKFCEHGAELTGEVVTIEPPK